MMTTSSEGAFAPAASTASADFKEFIVKRDGNRPISFAGRILAKDSVPSNVTSRLTGALYQTRGGKFVATLSKRDLLTTVLDEMSDSPSGGEFNKAQIFDTLDGAVAWFRPGRLTDLLRKQLGLDEPERIE